MPSPSANRLPVQHPEFRYSESKNIYWQKLKAYAGRVYNDHSTEEHRGHWRERFPGAPGFQPKELHVEIGCNAGHVVLEWAARSPENAYIGIDWKFKPIFWGIEKAVKRSVGNLLFFRAHAERLPYMFGEGEIDFLYLFFPDPWPKKKQWKNRFLTAQTLARIAPTLRKGGVFHIKTDHPGYFEWMLEAVAECERESGKLWEVVEQTPDLHAGNPQAHELKIPDVTLFERLFIKDGININSVKLKRL
jgi:tRNA (guanine-N7-)-methyltransferase